MISSRTKIVFGSQLGVVEDEEGYWDMMCLARKCMLDLPTGWDIDVAVYG